MAILAKILRAVSPNPTWADQIYSTRWKDILKVVMGHLQGVLGGVAVHDLSLSPLSLIFRL